MTYTNFPSGITSFGIPTFGSGGLLPFTGSYFWVNETTGSDGNTGGASDPFKTLARAINAATANNGDVIFIEGTIHTTATIAWSKNGVNLIGLTSPSNNCQAGISAQGATAFSPLVNVTGTGCIFANLSAFHGGFTGATGSQVCWNDAGGDNGYFNVEFFGGGDATTAALAGMRSLTITTNGNNQFVGCTIGLDTVTRATNANASLELLSGTARNVFRSCIFQALVSDASDVHVTVGAAGMGTYCLFQECTFVNAVDSTATAMSAAITADAAAGGSVLVQGGASVGATAIATTGPVYVSGAVPTATTSSIAIHAT